MRRKRVDKDKSMFAYDNDDYDIREDVMDYDEDGAGLYIFTTEVWHLYCFIRKMQ